MRRHGRLLTRIQKTWAGVGWVRVGPPCPRPCRICSHRPNLMLASRTLHILCPLPGASRAEAGGGGAASRPTNTTSTVGTTNLPQANLVLLFFLNAEL